MFIQCSACNSKYLVNSADLKPEGRMVECASCSHQWLQEPILEENLLKQSTLYLKNVERQNPENDNSKVKNLPSTFDKEKKVSILNSILVVIFVATIIICFLFIRSFGTNIFVLIKFYIQEFYFNLKLIISDIAKIIHQILN